MLPWQDILLLTPFKTSSTTWLAVVLSSLWSISKHLSLAPGRTNRRTSTSYLKLCPLKLLISPFSAQWRCRGGIDKNSAHAPNATTQRRDMRAEKNSGVEV